jgi:hypothetical protein
VQKKCKRVLKISSEDFTQYIYHQTIRVEIRKINEKILNFERAAILSAGSGDKETTDRMRLP